MPLAIYVFRQGEVASLESKDALKVIASALASGFTLSELKHNGKVVTAKYSSIAGDFDITVQEQE